MDLHTDGWGIELWPRPKVGDSFSIVMDVRENWFYEFLRRIKLRRKPRRTETKIHTITQITSSLE